MNHWGLEQVGEPDVPEPIPLAEAKPLVETRPKVGGYSSSSRPASDLRPPPAGPAPGARR